MSRRSIGCSKRSLSDPSSALERRAWIHRRSVASAPECSCSVFMSTRSPMRPSAVPAGGVDERQEVVALVAVQHEDPVVVGPCDHVLAGLHDGASVGCAGVHRGRFFSIERKVRKVRKVIRGDMSDNPPLSVARAWCSVSDGGANCLAPWARGRRAPSLYQRPPRGRDVHGEELDSPHPRGRHRYEHAQGMHVPATRCSVPDEVTALRVASDMMGGPPSSVSDSRGWRD
jgi:hypothetical protein